MASHLLLVFFLFTTTTTISTATTTTTTPPPPFCPLQPPFQKSTTYHHTHFNSIINSLNQTPHFNNLAHFLSITINPFILPPSFTLFVPLNHPSPMDPLLANYHIVPHRLTFNSLLHLPIGARLPTLLPTFSLLITNHSSLNFTINSVNITHPNLYRNPLISVHGITSVFNHTVFGKDPLSPSKEGKKEPSYVLPYNDRFFWGTLVIALSVMLFVWKGDGMYTRPNGWIFLLVEISIFVMHWLTNYRCRNDGSRVLWSLAPFNLFCATTHFGGRFDFVLHQLGILVLLLVSLLVDFMDLC